MVALQMAENKWEFHAWNIFPWFCGSPSIYSLMKGLVMWFLWGGGMVGGASLIFLMVSYAFVRFFFLKEPTPQISSQTLDFPPFRKPKNDVFFDMWHVIQPPFFNLAMILDLLVRWLEKNPNIFPKWWWKMVIFIPWDPNPNPLQKIKKTHKRRMLFQPPFFTPAIFFTQIFFGYFFFDRFRASLGPSGSPKFFTLRVVRMAKFFTQVSNEKETAGPLVVLGYCI